MTLYTAGCPLESRACPLESRARVVRESCETMLCTTYWSPSTRSRRPPPPSSRISSNASTSDCKYICLGMHLRHPSNTLQPPPITLEHTNYNDARRDRERRPLREVFGVSPVSSPRRNHLSYWLPARHPGAGQTRPDVYVSSSAQSCSRSC